jgi:hypothetical protein
MLKAALEETRSQERARLNWIESKRERIDHEEHRAQERVERTHDSYQRVHTDALERLEKVLREKEEFEQKIAVYRPIPIDSASADELEELCRIASDVPRLWHHEAVTHQERKEILAVLLIMLSLEQPKKR